MSVDSIVGVECRCGLRQCEKLFIKSPRNILLRLYIFVLMHDIYSEGNFKCGKWMGLDNRVTQVK